MRLVPQITDNFFTNTDKKQRGINVYHLSEIVGVSARNKDGEMVASEIQLPIFILRPSEREAIARINPYIFGVVNGRSQKISSMEWNIVRKENEEDRIVQGLKYGRELWNEYDDPGSMKDVMVRGRVFQKMKEELPEIKPDLSNFDSALRRWRQRSKAKINQSAEQIKEWVNHVNPDDDFEEYKKKVVFDLMVHGAVARYKQWVDGDLENIYVLPGGSVLPLRGQYIGSGTGYVQLLELIDPKIYFSDEMIFDNYIPVAARSYGMIPIEALINKIAESQLFDKLAAERADGTTPPQKMVIFGETGNILGDLSNVKLNTPMDKNEQKRIETKLNTERKNAVITLSGHGTPVVADISKADTFSSQSERQDKLLRDIALVFNTTTGEVNLTGSEDTSGRATSESQERIDREKGVYPILKIIDKTWTHKIIPFKFGSGWMLEHKSGLSDMERIKLETAMLQSGTYDVNTIREERGDDPYDKEEFNYPQGVQEPQQGTEQNPMMTQAVQ